MNAFVDASVRATVLLALAIAPATADAQGQPRPQPPPRTHEVRVDARLSDHSALEIGGSLIVPAGIYSRTAFTASFGVSDVEYTTPYQTKFEVISRFLLDPFRESRYGFSVGGGAGVTNSEGRLGPPKAPDGRQSVLWRPYLAVVADLELKKTAGWTPAVQVGLGGGVRLAFILRSANDRWR